MIRVFIVDDHAIVRAGLREIVSAAGDIRVCGDAPDGAGLFDVLNQESCEVVLLDISLGQESGFTLLAQIRARYPNVQVLMLSMYSEKEYALRALEQGASGYLTKESAPQDLLRAIRKVAAGGKFITPDLAEELAGRLDPASRPVHERLSTRERQIFELIVTGKRVTDIAQLCSVSVKTVSTYRRRILDKMELTNTAELIRYAYDHHLCP